VLDNNSWHPLTHSKDEAAENTQLTAAQGNEY